MQRKSLLILWILISVFISFIGCKTSPDSTAPVPGAAGTITTSDIGTTSVTISWTTASDDTSDEGALQYLAYYSTSNNLDSVENIEANGIAVGSYGTDISTISVSSLSDGTAYYFNVIVRDEAGNKAAYTSVSASTSVIPPDTTPPTAGALIFSNVESSSISVTWTASTDNTTAEANLEYLLYYSMSDNIGSLANAESNGMALGSYTANMTSKTVTGLMASTTYYFNVIVRDEAGNKAAYTMNSQATTASTP